MSGAMADIDNGLDQTEDEGQRWIAENMQGLYQELGLDPIVANLDLDRVNPHLRQLAKATQASAVSSLMELGGCVRTDSTVAGSPSKRPRGPNGFHIPEALEPANKARRETPVRKRINVDGSPTSKRGMGDLDSPSCHDFGTPGPTIAWTPRQSPRSRHDDDSLHAVAALLATPTKNRGIKPAHKKNGKHSPASDDEAAHSPPPAASAGAAGGKASRPNGAPASTPGNSSLLLNDKDKKNQGLRQFSLRVCRQVEAKMTTTYNEVADELVKEFKDEETDSDEKNIRRRAYDALNVLTAMDIISKDKKDIQWKGFPPMVGDGGERAAGASSAGRDKEKARLKSKIDQKSKDLKQKEEQLKELVNQFVSLKQLLSRNAKPEYSENADQLHRIYLPFVIVNTDADNTIECDISTDKRSAEFNCTKPFKLYDDRETLSLMRMGQVDQESIAKMLPDPGLLDFLRQNHQQQTVYSAVGAVISDPNYDEEDMDDDDQ